MFLNDISEKQKIILSENELKWLQCFGTKYSETWNSDF